MRLATLLALLLSAAPAIAQPTPGCATGDAEAFLDVAGVRAGLYNTGGLFWRGLGAQYEVPIRSGKVAVFSASLMVGGRVDDELRFAGSTYGPWEFWPGPAPGGTTSVQACADADRIWVVGTEDLDRYDATGVAAADLAEWPVGLGAPFFVDADGDGRQGPAEPTRALDPGDAGYGTKALDLEAGERPVVFGRQTAWWVMNDVGGPHAWSTNSGALEDSRPLGVEVRVTAWAQGSPDERALFNSTFYRYEVVNRSDDTIRDLHAGLFVDSDLGNFNDDYAGTDSTRQMLFFYNGDDTDEGGGGYGTPPPAIGVDALSGAWAAPLPYKNGAYGEPANAVQGHHYLRGLWRDGTPVRVGGFGYDTDGPVTRWAFSGDPVDRAFWSHENIDGQGTPITPSDKRGMISSLPQTLAPGERFAFDVGFLFARGDSRLGSVAELRRVSDVAQAAYDSGGLTTLVETPPAPTAPTLVPFASAPDGDTVTFRWRGVPDAQEYRLEILDAPDAAEPILSLWTGLETSTTVDAFDLPLNRREPLYWRVRAVRDGVASPFAETQEVTVYAPVFDRFVVLANRSGVLAEPVSAAPFGFPGFSFPDAATPQQTNGTRWYITAEGARTFREFLDVALEGGNADRAFPHDFEARFTGPALAERASDGVNVPIPFEVWDIGVGTPDDPADDVRLIPVLHDGDGDGQFSFFEDPQSYFDRTDAVSWHLPVDPAPGDRGYRAWAEGAGGVGPPVLSRIAFQRTSAGDATRPEPGTVFRLSSSSQALPLAAEDGTDGLAVAVRPNPTATRAVVRFRLAAPGEARLRVVDALGREVRTLADGPREAGEHTVALDTSALAPGVYVAVLTAGGEQTTRAFTVVR